MKFVCLFVFFFVVVVVVVVVVCCRNDIYSVSECIRGIWEPK
jgi:hypothetical protein